MPGDKQAEQLNRLNEAKAVAESQIAEIITSFALMEMAAPELAVPETPFSDDTQTKAEPTAADNYNNLVDFESRRTRTAQETPELDVEAIRRQVDNAA